jgi:hypothetical protein
VSANLGQIVQYSPQGQIFGPQNISLTRFAAFAREQLPYRHILHAHHGQACIDKCGHGASQKIDDDLSGRSRLEIVVSHRGSRIYNYYRQSVTRKFQRDLFSQKFGPFVVARHVIQRTRLAFIAHAAFGNSHASNRAGINDPFNPGRLGGVEHVPHAFHVRPIHASRIPRP